MSIRVGHNLRDFEQALQTITDDLRTKAVARATGAAARVVRKASEQTAPVAPRPHALAKGRVVSPGYMKSQIYVYKRRAEQTGTVSYRLSVRGGKSGKVTVKDGASTVRDAYYWTWVHEGHTTRIAKGGISGGKRTKAIKRSAAKAQGRFVSGNPFMRRAFFANTEPAVRAFESTMDRAITGYNKLKR